MQAIFKWMDQNRKIFVEGGSLKQKSTTALIELAKGAANRFEFKDRIPAPYELETKLLGIQKELQSDIEAALEGDPSVYLREEVVACFPSVEALWHHRIAHLLFEYNVPFLPRLLSERAHNFTGIDIHPGAKIGTRCFIDHGTGVVIGETAVVGDRVRIYQGVTLGAKKFKLDENGQIVKGILRHPVIEDDVVIYSGASVLGRVRIGKGAVIGGNVWITKDVPPNSMITQTQYTHDRFANGDGI